MSVWKVSLKLEKLVFIRFMAGTYIINRAFVLFRDSMREC